MSATQKPGSDSTSPPKTKALVVHMTPELLMRVGLAAKSQGKSNREYATELLTAAADRDLKKLLKGR
jgi:hypothetical protein